MTAGQVTLYIATSVDGFIATDDGGVEWLENYDAEASYESFVADVDCLVMGSTTYEQVRSFGEWPYGDRPTYVLTSRDLPRANDGVVLHDGSVESLVDRLDPDDHVWLVGGATVAQAFLRARRVDELRLTLAPVLLGSGIPLFGDLADRQELSLRETTTYEDGLVELQYDVESSETAR